MVAVLRLLGFDRTGGMDGIRAGMVSMGRILQPKVESGRLGIAVTDGGAIAMARALQQNATITDLHLDFNQIGEDGAPWRAIARAE